jgi:hypothetical protein
VSPSCQRERERGGERSTRDRRNRAAVGLLGLGGKEEDRRSWARLALDWARARFGPEREGKWRRRAGPGKEEESRVGFFLDLVAFLFLLFSISYSFSNSTQTI